MPTTPLILSYDVWLVVVFIVLAVVLVLQVVHGSVSRDMEDQIKDLQEVDDALIAEVMEDHDARWEARPLDRHPTVGPVRSAGLMPRLKRTKDLVYAAAARCPCGYGLAYDRNGESGVPIHGYWDCAGILLGKANPHVTHTAKLPFAFYEIKGEQQPSAHGMTTRDCQPYGLIA